MARNNLVNSLVTRARLYIQQEDLYQKKLHHYNYYIYNPFNIYILKNYKYYKIQC